MELSVINEGERENEETSQSVMRIVSEFSVRGGAKKSSVKRSKGKKRPRERNVRTSDTVATEEFDPIPPESSVVKPPKELSRVIMREKYSESAPEPQNIAVPPRNNEEENGVAVAFSENNKQGMLKLM